jgi:hypothetical protein
LLYGDFLNLGASFVKDAFNGFSHLPYSSALTRKPDYFNLPRAVALPGLSAEHAM